MIKEKLFIPYIHSLISVHDFMKTKKTFFLLLVMILTPFFSVAKDYNILSYGAVADGRTLNTKAIQKAIDQAYNDGGGRVIIPAGKFLSGSIVLKTGVEIHLLKKATLLGSTNPDDYIRFRRWKALLIADSVNNIGISGKGTINGQGSQLALFIDSLFDVGKVDSSDYNFIENRPRVEIRPQIIDLLRCKDVKITDVTFRNAASWVQSYTQCKELIIDGITVDSDAYWNNDGIDIIDCQNVRITNCNINSSDDGICLKSYNWPKNAGIFCDSIYISKCIIRSSASAIKLGTGSYDGFKNITVENIKIYDTYRSAIALESYQNGTLENVLIQNIKAQNTGNAIFIRLGKYYNDNRVGKIKNVTIRNIKVDIPWERPDYKYRFRGPGLPFFHNPFPASITGLPQHPIDNITLENIQISYPGGGVKGYAYVSLTRLDKIPEFPNKYPEFSMFGELPAWGFYIRHVNGITMRNIKLKIRKKDYRPAFVFDDVKGILVESIKIEGDKKENSIILNNTENVEITY